MRCFQPLVLELHYFTDGSEKPIANLSKALVASQCNYSQIQKSILIIFALKNVFVAFSEDI